MTIIKWIAILLVTVYCAGLLVLYLRQREMLFPIPPVGRTRAGTQASLRQKSTS